jgi:hypothetical protein
MIRSTRLGPVSMIRLSAIGGLFFLSLPGWGQAGLNLSSASNCTVADFDANLQFVNDPGDSSYAIVVHKRNISSRPCIFDGPMYGPTFVPDRVPGDRPFVLCYDCENRLPTGRQPIVPPLTQIRVRSQNKRFAGKRYHRAKQCNCRDSHRDDTEQSWRCHSRWVLSAKACFHRPSYKIADGERISEPGGNWFTRSFGGGYPDLDSVVEQLEKHRANDAAR